MLKENGRFVPDIRVSIFLGIISSIAILNYKNEPTFILAFAIAIIFILLQGQYKRALRFVIAFFILFLCSYFMVGITKLQTLWLFATIGRHLLIPLSFISGLSDKPAGMILEVFNRLHLPKSFGISSIILMRFLPTIKYELSAIRGSLKFRGMGISILSTIIYLPQNFYLTLIPLLVRTVRISDEITAAALTRGIELNNSIVSFFEVKWTNKDSFYLIFISVFFVVLKIIEIKWGCKI